MQKQFYEKPIIIRHTVGLANKFGRAPSAVPFPRIDGVPIRSLIQKYGSPLFVTSEQTLRRKYRDLKRAFSLRYPKVQISYSYKTNYLSAICAVLQDEGAFAEVVSGFEYEIARALNVNGENIIFNGPHKTKEELKRAVSENAIINIDNYDEIYALEEIAKEMNTTIPVGIRLNMEIGAMHWDRFGFNYESAQAFEAVKRIQSGGLLKLRGLHCHAGTYNDNVEIYRTMAEKFVQFYQIIKEAFTIKLEYWDIGGGFASINTLHSAYLPGSQTCPSFDQYAEAICPVLMRGPFSGNDIPTLMMEPGRALVDEAMHLVTSVISQKRFTSGGKAYNVDAGVNLLFSSWWYRYEMQPIQDNGATIEDVSVYGPLCMQIDCVRQSVGLPPMRKGDALIIKNVGAYNFSQSMQFIQPRPAIVMISQNGDIHLIRGNETTEYLKQLESVPEHLKK
jgi:diaminopimelate decarboxylase